MTLTVAAVKNDIVAIKVTGRSAMGSLWRGCGTAFWVTVNGSNKLVTAAHIPWPPDKVSAVPANECLHVYWATGKASGDGEAVLTPHTPGTLLDYATIEFLNHDNAPSGKVFPRGAMPAVGAKVACFGFPGTFVVPPRPDQTDGEIFCIGCDRSIEAMVSCSTASEGYSGGPIFLLQSNGDVGDEVIGLMRGAPPLCDANPNPDGTLPHDPNKYVMFGAVSFN
jgi:hypothetical protein